MIDKARHIVTGEEMFFSQHRHYIHISVKSWYSKTNKQAQCMPTGTILSTQNNPFTKSYETTSNRRKKINNTLQQIRIFIRLQANLHHWNIAAQIQPNSNYMTRQLQKKPTPQISERKSHFKEIIIAKKEFSISCKELNETKDT